MGLRGRLRQTFSSSSKKSASTSSSASSKPKTKPTPSIYPNETHYTDRTDIEYYKANEIPKSKYRGKVDPQHQASLVAFSLTDAFAATTRRASLALSGTFSPGGTKSQSRVPSRVPSRRPSVVEGSHLRTEERVDSDSDVSRERSADSNTSSDSAVDAQSSDTASTSLSGPTSTTGTTAPTTAVAPTPQTTLTSPSNPKLAGGGISNDDHDMSSTVLSKQITAHDTPFTAEELEMAMSRATFRDRDGILHEVHVS